ncbi:isochorismatase family protein [Roseibium sp.]|uniref:isochorismatase family protein n=1 Tax=Roseibium sp. TaxID=1936156 RepID=UPI003262D784
MMRAGARRPQTLLELTGGASEWRRPTSAETVVILVAVQEEYRSGRLRLSGVDEALSEIVQLRARASELGIPVVHACNEGGLGDLFEPAASGIFCSEGTPRPGELVISKTTPNAFADTGLAEQLQRDGVKNIIVGGFMSHLCVSNTIRGGFEHGFRSAVVASACASRPLPLPAGGSLPGYTVHDAAMASMADLFAAVLPNVCAI